MLRNPNSIPAADTLIEDPVMEPFFISRSQTGGYTVYERVIKGDNNTEYIKTVSYPSNFGNALKTVAREILNEEGKKYSLKEYVDRWENVKNSLTSILE
tara:strand:- start:397 stop:693 length:297 start_codon:yes stop_codon:yes gene_type:complete